MGVMSGQSLLHQEVGEVVVISQHSHWMCHAFGMMMPVSQGYYNGEHFLILCPVAALGRHHGPWPECDRMPVHGHIPLNGACAPMPVHPRLPSALLREDVCDRKRRSIGLQADCLLRFEVS